MKSYSEELADTAAIENLKAEIDSKYLNRIKALEAKATEQAAQIASTKYFIGVLTFFTALSFLH